MMASPRKRFFFGEGSHDELPTTTTNMFPLQHDRFGSNRNLRLLPGRSLSGSAAILKQRYSYHPNSPHTRAFAGDPDGFVKTQFGFQPAPPPPCTSNWVLQLLGLLTAMALCLVSMGMHAYNVDLQHIITMRQYEIDHHLHHIKSLEKKVSEIKSEAFHLTEHIETLQERPNAGATELQRKLVHMEHYQTMIQHGIQTSAQRMVREKFGPGPYYYIELKLDFPGGDDTIILETAHLDVMPHSIHLFLEQVSHGLYDHTAVHRNAASILQAGPSKDPQAHAVFRQHPSLNSVLFQEYNPNFPHVQYTLGYSGRPGGPDFYINVKDNSQFQNNADPCFARVVDGLQVIQRLQQQPVRLQDVLVQPVSIERMRVIMTPDHLQTPTQQQPQQTVTTS